MIPLFSTKQVRDLDEYAINKLGIPSIALMENASRSIYDISSKKLSELEISLGSIGFLCGKGNNGGDGFATARHFANHGFFVKVISIGNANEMTEDCKKNFLVLSTYAKENKKIKIKKFKSSRDLNILNDCTVIFDALLGSGMKGELREPYKSIVKKVNKIDSYKVAIDIPTGLDSDKGTAPDVFFADLTITLSELKKGLFFLDGYAHAGEIEKGSIGIDERFFDRYPVSEYLIEPEDVLKGLPLKGRSIHKYSAGKVLTIAGSGKLPGAACFASKAAFRVGAGASILLFPESVRNFVQVKLDEVILESYKDNSKQYLSLTNLDEINNRIKWADAVAIGPGLGREKETQRTILKIIEEQKSKNIVIDADAVFALGNKNYKNINLKNFVLTPHLGEFANLISTDINKIKGDILHYGRDFAQNTKAYLVLKGAPTIVFNPIGEMFINTAGNSGMAKFGTGDVLTGVIAGFLAQTNNIEEAIITGVYLHSLSADLLEEDFTEYGYTAEDILQNLPFAIRFLQDSFV